MTRGPSLSDPGTYPSDRSSRGFARTQSNEAFCCMHSDPFKDGNPPRSTSALAAIDSSDVADIWIGAKPALTEFSAYCNPGYALLKLRTLHPFRAKPNGYAWAHREAGAWGLQIEWALSWDR